MQGAMPLPTWALALVAAAFAPFVARALAVALERRVKERSERVLGTAGSATTVGSKTPDARPSDVSKRQRSD